MTHSDARPWPGLFEVALEPAAYGALAWQLLGLPLGILGFTWVATGLSLSLGLAIIGVGLFLGLAYLLACRGLAWADARVAAGLAGQKAPDAAPIPEGRGFWDRLGQLLKDPASWGAQAFLLLRLPLGIAAFTALITLLCFALSALVFGLAPWHRMELGPDGWAHLHAAHWHASVEPEVFAVPERWLRHPGAVRLTAAALGFGSLIGSLHLAVALTRLEAWLGRALLRGSRA